MTLTWIIYALFSTGYRRLLAAIETENASYQYAVVNPAWRNRHQGASSEYPTATTLRCYQY
jgi:hypothetical protein